VPVECGGGTSALAVAEPIEAAGVVELVQHVRAAVAGLEPKLRAFVGKRWLERKPLLRVARELGLTRAAARAVHDEAFAALRRQLGFLARGLDR
ncbi:MAG TPA: hypothetical protein VKE69_02810, partial [Planctomycetota bacterium]|nr:hypothetical protein [Planctomycetota bacterium]